MIVPNGLMNELSSAENSPESQPEANETAPDTVILERLLRMADGYRSSHAPRQAEELYFELARDHRDTRPGQQARARLLEMCEHYEREGSWHRARGIYEQLL